MIDSGGSDSSTVSSFQNIINNRAQNNVLAETNTSQLSFNLTITLMNFFWLVLILY